MMFQRCSPESDLHHRCSFYKAYAAYLEQQSYNAGQRQAAFQGGFPLEASAD